MENYIDIDLNALHVEWREQPKEYRKIATLLNEAKADLREAEAQHKLVLAEVWLDVQANPHKYFPKDAKVLKDAIDAAVTKDERVQASQKTVLDLKREVGQLDAELSTLEQRKYALENEVKLWLNDYYAEPRGDQGDSERIQEKRKQQARKGLKK